MLARTLFGPPGDATCTVGGGREENDDREVVAVDKQTQPQGSRSLPIGIPGMKFKDLTSLSSPPSPRLTHRQDNLK